ncbi:MAG: helix-turn-helix domain containing protein [Anaerolineales bacterium]|nr:helix-turn-helix domain containing protein [Anaerolineales bacterium]
MSNKGQTTTWVERVTIAEQVRAGQSSREIATEMGRSVATVRKWRQKYLREGRAGLSSQIGKPAAGTLATASVEMKDAILELREQHPGWSAQTLRLEISKDERFTGLRIPSRARIAAYLKEQQKVRKYGRHQDLPEPKTRPVQRPHQEWEMDAQGVTRVAGWVRSPLLTCWMSLAMPISTAMLVQTLAIPSRKNTSGFCGVPSSAMGCRSRSAWITTALFTITRAPRLFQALSIFG